MSKIYLASSWRNERYPDVVRALRDTGHEVYDFRNPGPGERGFGWREVDPNWQQWTPEQYREALNHPIAQRGLRNDFDAMQWSDTIVAVQPFGRSTALELGWGIGSGRSAAVLLAPAQEPELMQGLAHRLCLDVDELLGWLRDEDERRELAKRHPVIAEAAESYRG